MNRVESFATVLSWVWLGILALSVVVVQVDRWDYRRSPRRRLAGQAPTVVLGWAKLLGLVAACWLISRYVGR